MFPRKKVDQSEFDTNHEFKFVEDNLMFTRLTMATQGASQSQIVEHHAVLCVLIDSLHQIKDKTREERREKREERREKREREEKREERMK